MLARPIAPKGTKDVLPDETYKWHYIENAVRDLVLKYGYREIRTPTFEHTELFERGVGNETDIVQKEMYTFTDKAGRSISLKPEGTAGVVRAYIEKGLHSWAQPVKMYYITPVFRYEAPQSGRLREHHQFGVEVFGAAGASVDAEVISLAAALFRKIGIDELKLNINSIGCEKCRPSYHTAMKAHMESYKDELCDTCKGRFERNPLRILDCKEENCRKISAQAPVMLDYLCLECSRHFDALKSHLITAGIEFHINPMIVRGLDYYTKTVFEFITTKIGAQGTVCGGGRYDRLVADCGGTQTPGVGFGLGLERLLMLIEAQKITIPQPLGCFVYIAILNKEAEADAFRMLNELRARGIPADMDHAGRSLKAQFRYAGKMNFRWVCMAGGEELSNNEMKLKDMEAGQEQNISIEQVADFFEQEYKRIAGGNIINV